MFRPLPLFIGLRYTRAKRRNQFISFISVLSILGITLGVTVLITVLSVINGFHTEVRDRILSMASHADLRAYDGDLQNWRSALDKASRHPQVVGAAPYIDGQGLLSHRDGVSGAMVRGILPELEPRVVDVAEHMQLGRLDDLRPGEFSIILGQELAFVLGVSLGDKVTVIIPKTTISPLGSMPRLKRFTVAGIFKVDMQDFDRNLALIHMDDAAKLWQMRDGVSGVRLKLVDLFQAREVSRELAYQFGELFRVLNWTDFHPNFFAALEMEKRMLGLLLFFLVVIAAFNIITTLVMAVIEKQSDIAILKTFGATPRLIMGVFVVQGSLLGLFGTLVGLTCGVLLALNVEDIVAWIEVVFDTHFLDPSVYYISRMPSELHWDDVAYIGLGAFSWSLLMTLYPAWQAFRTQPAEALRYE